MQFFWNNYLCLQWNPKSIEQTDVIATSLLRHYYVILFLCTGIRIEEFVQEVKLVMSVIKNYNFAFKMFNFCFT